MPKWKLIKSLVHFAPKDVKPLMLNEKLIVSHWRHIQLKHQKNSHVYRAVLADYGEERTNR